MVMTGLYRSGCSLYYNSTALQRQTALWLTMFRNRNPEESCTHTGSHTGSHKEPTEGPHDSRFCQTKPQHWCKHKEPGKVHCSAVGIHKGNIPESQQTSQETSENTTNQENLIPGDCVQKGEILKDNYPPRLCNTSQKQPPHHHQ